MNSSEIWDLLALEEIESERDEINIDRYDIKVSLIQPSIQSIIQDLNEGDIYIPKFQRNFRWSLEKASKLIESFLLGLPVPPIFVYKDKSERLVVIDGQQRLLSLYFFIEKGFYPKESLDFSKYEEGLKNIHFKKTRDIEFRLRGVKSEWNNKTFKDLKNEDKRFLLKTPLWIIIVWQIKPEDELSSVFYIFERLNTGGELLSPMEIRKALYYGDFYKFLENLNKDPHWRRILGMKRPHKKLMDIEILLRILYLSANWERYKEPMKERLNEFMRKNKSSSAESLRIIENKLRKLFQLIDKTIVQHEIKQGQKPFALKGKRINISFLDSFMSLSLKYLDRLDKQQVIKLYYKLKSSNEFREIIERFRVSTDEKGIKERFQFIENQIKSML